MLSLAMVLKIIIYLGPTVSSIFLLFHQSSLINGYNERDVTFQISNDQEGDSVQGFMVVSILYHTSCINLIRCATHCMKTESERISASEAVNHKC